MAWIEVPEKRIRRGKTWHSDVDDRLRLGHFSLAPFHYETSLDSGIHDAEIDAYPTRTQSAALDGWRIQQNGFHYALGIPGSGLLAGQDGVVGYGGRQGQNWLAFRLLRVGYFHWPTRAWQDVGGAPTYERANLTSENRAKLVGPDARPLNVEGIARWSGLWTTPGGGDLSISWRVNGDQLKEEITINRVGRDWIAANRPPSTALSETFFGFVFQLDWTDIPRVYRAGILQDRDGDFADDGEQIELRDDLNRLLTLLPVDYVMAGVRGRGNGGVEVQPLRKRFWRDGSDHYLLVGIRADVLNGMRAGPLVFDPTFDLSNTNQDAHFDDDSAEYNVPSSTKWGAMYVGYDGGTLNGGWIWATTIDEGATIQTAEVVVYRDSSPDYSGGFTLQWRGVEDGSPTVFANDHTHRPSAHFGATIAATTVTDDNWANAASHTSPDLTDIIQEIVDDTPTGDSPSIALYTENRTTAGGWWAWHDYSDGAANAADLTVTWSTGGAALVRVIDETAQLSESRPRLMAMRRFGPETVQLSEATLRPRAMARIADESAQWIEAVARSRVLVRLWAETEQIAETAPRLTGLLRWIGETEQVGESASRRSALTRAIAETLNLSEGSISARTLARIVGETAGLVEGVGRLKAMVRVTAESEQVSEGAVRARGFVRVVAETVQSSEAVSRIIGFVRAVSETVQAGEGTLRSRALARILGETVQTSESSLRSRAMARIVAETQQLQETAARLKAMVRAISETENLSETVADVLTVGVTELVRVISETVQTSETASRLLGLLRAIDETQSLSEVVTRVRALVRRANETEQVGEATLVPRVMVRIASETERLVEAAGRFRQMARILGETVQSSEAVTRVTGFVQVVSETVSVAEGLLQTLTQVVLSALRTYVVGSENRTLEAPDEDRSATVDGEDRTHEA